MSSSLVELFRHNRWANLRLLDACKELDETQLDAAAVGTYGRIRDTLVHLLAAEERYVSLLSGQPHDDPLRESNGFPGFEALRTRAEHSGQGLIEIAAQDPYGRVLEGQYGGQPFELRAFIPLVQAINHGNEHRAHVMTIMTQCGVEPPDLSGWAYNDATV